MVMDTNVAVVANGRTPQASQECVAACVQSLRMLRDRHTVLLDDLGRIFDEYRRHLSPSGQPGLGDAFFKWLWDNQCNPGHCRQVRITPTNDDRGFEEFPDDPALSDFDPSDRKFIAVAIASGETPPILNASDTDWWNHREALSRNGVTVRFLCPELMAE
ncbi:MAG TPA: hypothetical protein VLE27_15070 [Thermoanaerobaculia bacterium]|nr:hypothetical protein [Thermoanaerobaculia bacterium]